MSRSHNTIPLEVQGPRILLLLAVLALTLLGLVMVYSASAPSLIEDGVSALSGVRNQAIYALVGAIAALITWKCIPYRVWTGPFVWGAWGVSMLLLVLTAVSGSAEYGAQRWLSIGGFHLQPSEIAKVAFVLMAARIVYEYQEQVIELKPAIVQALILVLLPLLFLYKTQSDLGTTLICAAGILAVMWLGGVSLPVMLSIIGLGILFVLVAIFGTGYRTDRLVFLNPWDDGQNGLGAGYQLIRSFYAFAEGGLFGMGLGNSHEKYQYLFASDSDFIFAIIGEELGMVGALVVVALFLVILFAGLRIATNSSDVLGMTIAGGFAVMIAFQAFLNMGCAIGAFPTTGKPLPFISSGGTSIIMSMIMVGLILSVSHAQQGESAVYEKRRADLRLVRATRPQDGQKRRSRR